MSRRQKGGGKPSPDFGLNAALGEWYGSPLVQVEKQAPSAEDVVTRIFHFHPQNRTRMRPPDSLLVDEIRRVIGVYRSFAFIPEILESEASRRITAHVGLSDASQLAADLASKISANNSIMYFADLVKENSEKSNNLIDHENMKAGRIVLDAPDTLRLISLALNRLSGIAAEEGARDADEADKLRDIARAMMGPIRAACLSAGARGVSFKGNDSPGFKLLYWAVSETIAPRRVSFTGLFDIIRRDRVFSVKTRPKNER